MLLFDEDPKSPPLADRLKTQREAIDPVPCQLLRKYIDYARKYVHPRLSPEAAEVLQQLYLELRKKRQTLDSTPITTRQLESLIRLTEVDLAPLPLRLLSLPPSPAPPSVSLLLLLSLPPSLPLPPAVSTHPCSAPLTWSLHLESC